MAREFEVKYRLTENAKAAIARKYGPMDTIHMETVYYDTPSGALSARKWTVSLMDCRSEVWSYRRTASTS